MNLAFTVVSNADEIPFGTFVVGRKLGENHEVTYLVQHQLHRPTMPSSTAEEYRQLIGCGSLKGYTDPLPIAAEVLRVLSHANIKEKFYDYRRGVDIEIAGPEEHFEFISAMSMRIPRQDAIDRPAQILARILAPDCKKGSILTL